MKRLIVFLVLISYFVVYSQNDQQFNPGLPQIIPVSPEAASLGKFGDVPVNLSIGKLNFTVPIYTIKVGDFSYPIYLQYNSTGLKTEEDPALVGLGWTLRAEGMVTRQLRGLNDDHVSGWLTTGNELAQNISDPNWKKAFFDMVISGERDAQPDKFTINAGKFNCGFVFKEDGSILTYPFKNYQISYNRISNDIMGFVANDDNGVAYDFHTKELTEVSDNTVMPQYYSSWKLDSISFKNNDKKIYFNYFPADDDSLYVKTTYSEAKYPTGLPVELLNLATKKEFVTTIHQQILKNIIFPNGKIEFIIHTVPSNSYAKNKYYLDKIIVYEGNPVDGSPNAGYRKLRTYKFIYNNLLSNYHLLKAIQLYDADNNQQPFYRFSYYNEDDIPETIHYANQDSWGYYNGKNNVDLFHGDRSVDLYSTRLGALDTIFYPTGGYTHIEYELNQIKYLDPAFQYAEQCYSSPLSKHKIITASSFSSAIGPPEKRDTININCDQTIRVEFYALAGGPGISDASAEMNTSSYVDCNMLAGCSESCSQSESAHQEQGGEVNVDDVTNGNISLASFLSNSNGSAQVDYHHHVAYFDVSAGTQLFFKSEANGGKAIASIDIHYTDTCENIDVGGLRIKKTSDYTNGQLIVHLFEYVDESGYKSSGNLFYLPIFSFNMYYDFTFSSQMSNNFGFFIKVLSTSQVATGQGNTVFYDRVVTYTNDLNKGKTVNLFDNEGLTNMVVYPFYPVDLFTIKNGELKEQKILKNENQNFVLEKTKDYSYISLIYDTGVTGYLVDIVKYADLGTDFDYTPYTYFGKKLLLTYQQEKNYFSNDYVEKHTNYVYDNQKGYLKEQTTTDSNGNQIKLKNYYPFEIDNLNSLGSGNQAISSDELSAYQDLTQKNIIAKPVQVDKEIQSNGNTMRQKLRTSFMQIPVLNYTLPEKISVLKGPNSSNNDFDTRIIYYNYDDSGNPTEVSKAGGPHIYYIYGYQHSKPIAKIVNFTQAQAQNIQSLIDAAVTASDNDMDAASEDALRTALNNLRQALPDNTQITTYTYDPLVGVTSITDPKGDTQYYEYDALQRLKYIKDKNGHILKEYEYHYRE